MNEKRSVNVLVIGAGSIGERHIRAFRRIHGVAVSLVDPRSERAQRIAAHYGCESFYSNVDAVPLESFDAAVIATPANSHVSIADVCASRGLHLLIEKPLASKLNGIDELIARCNSKGLITAVGYTLRFDPTINKLRELAHSGLAGRLLSVRVTCSHYLPDSRPDYRQAYYSSPNAGAGVILDLSHELNYLEWILGELHLEACRRTAVAELNIADEAIADLWLRRSDGLPVLVHLHAADRHVSRECYLIGSDASLSANLLAGEILIEKAGEESELLKCAGDRDDVHLAEARDFIDAIRLRRAPRCSLGEALRTLQVSLHAMESPLHSSD